jgi:hypothetical protein
VAIFDAETGEVSEHKLLNGDGEGIINSTPFAATTESAAHRCQSSIFNCSTRGYIARVCQFPSSRRPLSLAVQGTH